MNGKTHLFAGVVGGIGIAYVLEKYQINYDLAPLIASSAFGSLLPDTDIKTSLLGRYIPVHLFFKHRTVTHSLFFVMIIGLLSMLFQAPWTVTIGLCVGLLTHLLLDLLTPARLPYLLYPIRYRGVEGDFKMFKKI